MVVGDTNIFKSNLFLNVFPQSKLEYHPYSLIPKNYFDVWNLHKMIVLDKIFYVSTSNIKLAEYKILQKVKLAMSQCNTFVLVVVFLARTKTIEEHLNGQQ